MASLEEIFNHVVLPPRLPGTQDKNVDAISRDLTIRLVNACRTLQELTGDKFQRGWTSAFTMLQTSLQVNGEFVDQPSLLAAFDTITSNGQILVCYVNEQNAGLLMHRKALNDKHAIVFEAFEVSPTTRSVLAAPNALRWNFPDRAVQIPGKDFQDAQFQNALATFLNKASSEHLSNFAATIIKAGETVPEIRNPSNPALITHMLMSILEAMGDNAVVPALHKRVRDDVHFDGDELPWRRLPFWLVLRVAAQRQLHLCHGAAVGYTTYKLVLCMVYVDLLEDCIKRRMHPSHVLLLQKKLGRKLAKLEVQSAQDRTDDEAKLIDELIASTSATFEKSIATAKAYVEDEYAAFKHSTSRRVPILPRRVEESACHLVLPSSGSYLTALLQNRQAAIGQIARPCWSDLPREGGVQKTLAFADETLGAYCQLNDAAAAAPPWEEVEKMKMTCAKAVPVCRKISDAISFLVELAASIPPSEPVHASSVLLTIFELWAKLDTITLKIYPMLADYAPAFPPDMLNVLQLPLLPDMKRLRHLQRYIGHRLSTSMFKDRTIFSKVGPLCFGVRFASESPDLQNLYRAIKDKQDEYRLQKEREWKSLCNTYEQLSERILSLVCRCTFDKDGKRDFRGCTRCYKWRQRKKLAIEICEDLLPKDDTQARAVVFELCVPECIAIYRSTTWAILSKLAYPQLPSVKGSPKTLKLGQKLAPFSRFVRGSSVTLASLPKSFSQTHYASLKMMVPLERVILPLASKFHLFDETSGLFVSDFEELPTLAHRCCIHIPHCLRGSVLPVVPHPPTYPDGPSSYATVASRPECPPGLSVHEFEAFQRLLSGRARRWFTIVVELGSANLNFSKQDLVLLLSHLALEAGPPRDENKSVSDPAEAHKSTLGVVHCAFADTDFVDCLLGQLKIRLDNIRGNWRETNAMEILITLVLRVHALARDSDQRGQALSLLELARSTTLDWTEALRAEVAGTTDSNNAHRASLYAFQAALLCRRTFVVFADDRSGKMGPGHLLCYVKASIALQQSLVVDVDALKNTEKIMLKRDIIMAGELRVQIFNAIRAYPDSMNEGISYGIGMVFRRQESAGGVGSIRFSSWEFHSGTNAGWVGTVIQSTTPGIAPQRIDFHYTIGHILVHGKTIGKLPDDIRESDQVKELFQGQHLLVYPSTLQGMSHRLVTIVDGRAIVHFGVNNGAVTIVTQGRTGEICELVPRHIFSSGDGVYDLPRGLVDDCTHWFNRTTRLVEIRRSSKWKSVSSDWTLNISQKTAQRRGVNLVDPHSGIALVLRKIFSYFEDGQRLTIFQPKAIRGALSVELRHLDLSFFVNANRCLECRELNAELDQDQDAHTLYGYRSMIVLRDRIDPTSRSIILPLGNLTWTVHGVHVNVQTDLDLGPRGRSHTHGLVEKAYARFGIDSTLGRLTCPPEPRLLYTKALLHAVTSCDIPDPLTGRTGEEEAVHTLVSGRCQPWMPLTAAYTASLFDQLKSLAPKREFYPPDKRVLQKITWDSFLPPYLQNDRYGRLVRTLLAKSERLRHFNDSPANEHPADASKQDKGDLVLERRGEVQRRRFQCSPADLEPDIPVADEDLAYTSRGCVSATLNQSHSLAGRCLLVFRIVKLLRGETVHVPMGKDVSTMLEDWTQIGGFGEPCSVAAMPITSFMDRATVSERWGGLVDMCRQAPLIDVMLALAQLSFAPDADSDVIHLLAAYSCLHNLSVLIPPQHAYFYGFKLNDAPTITMLQELITTAYIQFKYKPSKKKSGWNQAEEMEQQRIQYNTQCKQSGTELAWKLFAQWPEQSILSPPMGFKSKFIDVGKALAAVQPTWTRLKHNRDLSLYVTESQETLSKYRTHPKKTAKKNRNGYDSVVENEHRLLSHVSVVGLSLSRDLVSRALPNTISEQLGVTVSHPQQTKSFMDQSSWNFKRWPTQSKPPQYTELRRIVSSFAASTDPIRQAYGADLTGSLDALEKVHRQQQCGETSSASETVPTFAELSSQLAQAKKELKLIWEVLETSFSLNQAESVERTSQPRNWLKWFQPGPDEKPDPAEKSGSAEKSPHWLKSVDLWPRLTPVSLLELLRSSGGHSYGQNVQLALVSYGCALTKLQRLQRMRRALQKGDGRRLSDELQNSGHTNWRPIDVPDWLLLEIDANLLIRPEQVDVAQAIIDPASNSNSVLQLNMGKGKTSVIVPMAVAVLANGQQMCRLIVPKALLLPTAQPVQSQLGGLVGRELRHIPFSRHLTNSANIGQVVRIFKAHHEDLLRNRGVLLVAPEHVLAFNLSGRQCLVDGKLQPASDMIGFQEKLIGGMCRDILDESDFTLAVRTQLVYPSGQLTAVDGAPYRWKLIESLLSLVEDNLAHLCAKFPHSISTLPRPGGGFPMVYILQAGIEDELHERIVQAICNGSIPFFRPAPNSHEIQQTNVWRGTSAAIFRHYMGKVLRSGGTDADVEMVAKLFPDAQSAVNGLTLVRGLLHNGILVTCLKRRWNVQYGLHPERWPIAVPFEAKGVPSERSEFGHPDVCIILTCLSFYYAGLTQAQFREGLQHILNHTDDPATEYEQWTAGNTSAPLPIGLRNWNTISVDDTGQLLVLWKHLRFTRPVIDHYLNTFVFPVHSRQFSVKLQASAWDLPLCSLQEEEQQKTNRARTTGFSGTNDNKMMLPLTIKQNDLPSLRQTNAEVLTYLLQERSRHYFCTGTHGSHWSEDNLLFSLKANGIRVFIDAGAFILEKDNEKLARAWLQVDSRSSAAVFFGEKDNRAWVVFRNAAISKTPLVATPFVDKLDDCLVYFDEAHTRGVDLQLPAKAMGALTLALGQTKDHTVQAAMRLRQLGSTQSVVFYAPPEVDQSIRDVCGQNGYAFRGRIESPHVVTWLLEQTCLANEQLQPLYTSHGMDFCRRMDAQQTYGNWKTNSHGRQSLLSVLEQPERQTIQQLYGTSTPVLAEMAKGKHFRLPILQAYAAELDALHHRAHRAEPNNSGYAKGAFEEVEQEREVEQQVEQVRMPQKKTKFHGFEFPGVSNTIRVFVQTGRLFGKSSCKQVFEHISQTDIGKRYGVKETSSRLFVSNEFGQTIRGANSRIGHDDFMRPVEWLLWSPLTETGMVVIPEEVEELLPVLRTQQSLVHLVAYVAPVTRAMRAFSSLQFLALPALPAKHTLPSWLVIELGILAGRLYMSFNEAMSMSQYLREQSDLRGGVGRQSFCPDPVGFLLEWLPLRRATQDILHTPAGYICQGRTLKADDAFFSEPGSTMHSKPSGGPGGGAVVDDSESDDEGGVEWGEEYVHEDYGEE